MSSVIGLAIPARVVGDHFVAALVHALAGPLIESGSSLLTSVVDDDVAEERVYRHWAQIGGVSGVALLGVQQDDPRIALLRALDLPFAGVVAAENFGDYPAVVVDASASVDALRAFFTRHEYDRVVYFSDADAALTSNARAAAIGDHFHIARFESGAGDVVDAALATIADGPATLLFDSDVDAAAAMQACVDRGLRIPEDVSIVSWTESVLCQSTTPSITAVNRRGREIGAMLGTSVLEAVAGDRDMRHFAPSPFVVVRESA